MQQNLGAEVIQKKEDNIASAIMETVNEKNITTICLGKPHLNLFQIILKTSVFNQLLKTLSKNNIDIVISFLMALNVKNKIWLGTLFLFLLLIINRWSKYLLYGKIENRSKKYFAG